MRRYVTGMLAGALVGVVTAGVWLLARPQPGLYQAAVRRARRLGPRAMTMARIGGRTLTYLAKRRLG